MKWQMKVWKELTSSLDLTRRKIAKRTNTVLEPLPRIPKPSSPALADGRLSLSFLQGQEGIPLSNVRRQNGGWVKGMSRSTKPSAASQTAETSPIVAESSLDGSIVSPPLSARNQRTGSAGSTSTVSSSASSVVSKKSIMLQVSSLLPADAEDTDAECFTTTAADLDKRPSLPRQKAALVRVPSETPPPVSPTKAAPGQLK